MGFVSPHALWLLLVVPALASVYLLLLKRRHKQSLRYSSVQCVKDATRTGQHLRRHVPPLLLLTAIAGLIFSISRPTVMLAMPSEQRTIVLAIDVSVSMGAKDVEPDRLTAAQAAARKFIADQPRGIRTAIVSFAGFAAVVQPPTQRLDQLLMAIGSLRIAPHTAIGSGLLVSLAQIFPEASIDVEPLMHGPLRLWSNRRDVSARASRDLRPARPRSSASAAIILLSDGSRTVGPDPLDAADMAASHGVPVYTVGFGRPEGGVVEIGGRSIYVRMDERTLRTIANITGGEYFQATSAGDLVKVYQTLSGKLSIQKEETELTALVTAIAAIVAIGAAALSLLWCGPSGG